MSKGPETSLKRVAISKANAQIVIVVSVASFVTIFCLFAAKALFSQNSYQARVISAKEKAHKQLQTNLQNFTKLSASYTTFNSQNPNVIGGHSNGNSQNDGSNSQIILDALPDTYDFPALTSAVENVLTGAGLKVTSLTGTDDELNQQSNTSSPNPQAVSMPFSFTVDSASYSSVSRLIAKLQSSIRPIQIDTLELSGGTNNMTLTVSAHTYYQPSKAVSITQKEVK